MLWSARAEEISYSVVKLFLKYSNLCESQRHGQTNRQTAYCGITALCVASRGKNLQIRLLYITYQLPFEQFSTRCEMKNKINIRWCLEQFFDFNLQINHANRLILLQLNGIVQGSR